MFARHNIRNSSSTCGALILAVLGALCLWQSLPGVTASSQVLNSSAATPVSHSTSPKAGQFVAIQNVRLGQRVVAQNPTGEFDSSFGDSIEPELWRKLVCRAPKYDGSMSHVELLRPLSWLEEQLGRGNDTVFISVPECGIDGEAELVSVEPCPPIASGTGPVVTGYFRHQSAAIIDLHVEGLVEPIGVTANHLFWSADRKDFVPAGELQVGEALSGADANPRVTAIQQRPAAEAVYNLEILGEHCYRVGSCAVLAHNSNDPCPLPLLQIEGRLNADPQSTALNPTVRQRPTISSDELRPDIRDRGNDLAQEQGRQFHQDQLQLSEFDPDVPAHVRGWLANERRMIEQGRRTTPRVPPGYVLGHGRTTPAREGFDYSNSRLQGSDLNSLEESVRRRRGRN